jgi:hypothetical protein
LPPLAANDEYAATMGKTLSVSAQAGLLANDRDPNGLLMTASLVKGPANGTLHLNADGSFTFTPNNRFSGTTSFTYQAVDSSGKSVVATVTLDVIKAGAAAPKIDPAIMVVNDTYSVAKNTALTVDAQHGVLANDSDTDGDHLTAQLVSGSTSGTVKLNADGSFTFTPKSTFTGTTTFTYRTSDGSGLSTTATASITVGKGADNTGNGAQADNGSIFLAHDNAPQHDSAPSGSSGWQAGIESSPFSSSLQNAVLWTVSQLDQHTTAIADAGAPDAMPAPTDYLPDPLAHFFSEFQLA